MQPLFHVHFGIGKEHGDGFRFVARLASMFRERGEEGDEVRMVPAAEGNDLSHDVILLAFINYDLLECYVGRLDVSLISLGPTSMVKQSCRKGGARNG